MTAGRRIATTVFALALALLASMYAADAATSGVLIGPHGHPDATGDYGNSGSATQAHDFTATVLNVAPNASNQFVSVNGGSGGTAIAVPAGTTVQILNSVQNTGSSADQFYVSAPAALDGLPPGWSVSLYAADGNGSPILSAPLSSTQPTAAIPASGTLDVVAVYKTSTAVTMNAYFEYAVTLRAVSVNAGGTSVFNDTQNLIFVNGFVQLTKSVSIVSNGCPTLAYPNVPNLICSGGKMTYTIAYKNVMPPLGTNNVALSAIGFTLVEDGSATAGWAATTSGLTATPIDANGTIACANATCPGATHFTDTLGTLAPQQAGSVSFSVVVR